MSTLQSQQVDLERLSQVVISKHHYNLNEYEQDVFDSTLFEMSEDSYKKSFITRN